MNTQKHAIISAKNVKFFFSSLIMLVPILFAGCWWGSKSEKATLMIINVLDKSDFDDCHIKGSINIPFDKFEAQMKDLSKQNKYVLYCSNYACSAAPYCAKLMQDAGFSQVSVLPGGVVDWYQKGYPCSGPAQKEYLHDENESLGEEGHAGVTVISAQDLKAEMIAQGLL